MTSAHSPGLSDHRLQLTERLLDEGTYSLIEAAKLAGMRPVPCLRTLMRAAITDKLEAIKQKGRWTTSPAAIRRWIARQQTQRATAPAERADASLVLSRYRLGRGER